MRERELSEVKKGYGNKSEPNTGIGEFSNEAC